MGPPNVCLEIGIGLPVCGVLFTWRNYSENRTFCSPFGWLSRFLPYLLTIIMARGTPEEG